VRYVANLYLLVQKAQCRSPEAMAALLQMFEPKLRRSLLQTSKQEREDLEQELRIKIMEVIYKYDLDSTPGYWEFKNQFELKASKKSVG
jgi:hypothetical protein